MTAPRTLHLLDVSYFVSVAWEATRANPDDAARAFGRGLANLLARHEPSHVVGCLDAPGLTWRHGRHAGYKIGRAAKSEALQAHLARCALLLEEVGILTLGAAGYEADDVAATLARAAREDGWNVVLVTGDLDWAQIVSAVTAKPWATLDRVDGPVELLGAEWVQHRWGVEPFQLPHLWALSGKRSSGIPGVPGVGEQTAAALIQWVGSVVGLYARHNVEWLNLPYATAQVKGVGLKTVEALETHEHDARLSLALCTLRADVPIELIWDDCALDWGAVVDTLRERCPHPGEPPHPAASPPGRVGAPSSHRDGPGQTCLGSTGTPRHDPESAGSPNPTADPPPRASSPEPERLTQSAGPLPSEAEDQPTTEDEHTARRPDGAVTTSASEGAIDLMKALTESLRDLESSPGLPGPAPHLDPDIRSTPEAVGQSHCGATSGGAPITPTASGAPRESRHPNENREANTGVDSVRTPPEAPSNPSVTERSLHPVLPVEVGLTDDQWRQRQGRITASLVPQILGLSRYGGPLTAWASITGRLDRGETSEPAELGLLYEEGALRLLARRHPEWDIQHNRGTTWERDEWAAATPDGIVGPDPRLIEIKHRGYIRRDDGWGEPGTADVPLDVLVQVLWQLWVCGVGDCTVALGAHLRLREYPVPYQAAGAEALVARLRAWHERHVLGDEEPTVADALPETLAALRAVHGEVTGELLEPDDQILELARRRHVFDQKAKQYLEYRALCDARLEQLCGDAAGIDGVVTRYEARGRLDYTALLRDVGADDWLKAAGKSLDDYRGAPSARTRFKWSPDE